MKMRKCFILCLLVTAIFWLKEPLQAFFNELAIYSNPVLSPDENQVVFECRDWNTGMEGIYDSLRGSDIFLVDIKGSNLRQLSLYTDRFWTSPDKSKVLLQTYYGLYLLDLAKRPTPRQVFNRFPKDILDGRDGSVEQISWSPNSTKFFFAKAIGLNYNRKYSVIDAETLEEKVLDNELKGLGAPIQWLGDSTIVFEKQHEIQYFNYFTKAWDYLATGMPDEPCTDPVLSPDGNWLLYRYMDQYKIRPMPIADGKFHGRSPKKVVCQVKDLPDWAANELTKSLWSGDLAFLRKIDYLQLQGNISQVKVSWSADSRKVLIKGQKELWLYSVSDSSYTPLCLDSIPITGAIMTPDQNKIFFISSLWSPEYEDARITGKGSSSSLKVYDLKNKVCRTIFVDSGPISQLRLSSDGSSLALVRGGNIWVVNTATEKEYQLTLDGGTKPQWLLGDKSMLFVSNGSLVQADLETRRFTYLTLGRGTEPVWISNKEVAVKSQGKFWQVSVDKIGVKDLQKYPDQPALTKGKKYEVYIDEINLTLGPNLTQVKVRDLKTSQEWVVKQTWCNYPWALEEKNR